MLSILKKYGFQSHLELIHGILYGIHPALFDFRVSTIMPMYC